MYNGNKEALNIFLKAHASIREKNDCWLWKGPVDKNLGYGRTSWIGSSMTAHKVSYILAYGDYLRYINGRRTCIRHLCNNKLCINPYHLALGTYTNNGRDASEAGINTKMTLSMLKTSKELRDNGTTYKKIGKVIGVSETVVSMSLRGKTYYCREMLKQLI